MNIYAFCLIIWNDSNFLLRCGRLLHQYVVNLYAKIQGERLLFLRLNQKMLHVEEYVHLRDAIAQDQNVSQFCYHNFKEIPNICKNTL